jgi:alkanesulfonate monooxygenase SsuD/methylene tetrahydromethanopterin reductase-like flavin-dependent oxidoreductase (luciferase family)
MATDRTAAVRGRVGEGSLYVGSPDTVARKIASAVQALDVGRFDLIYTAGSIPASARLHAVELYGTEVIPRVRALLADSEEKVASA